VIVNGIRVAPDATKHQRTEFRLMEIPLGYHVEFVAQSTGRTHLAWINKFDGVYASGPVKGLPGITANLLGSTDVDRFGDNAYRVVTRERRQGRSRVNGW